VTNVEAEMKADQQPVFVVALRPLRHVDGIKALRALIKVALRRFGLRVVATRECERSTDITAALN
jgi:hypothetical protein